MSSGNQQICDGAHRSVSGSVRWRSFACCFQLRPWFWRFADDAERVVQAFVTGALRQLGAQLGQMSAGGHLAQQVRR
jgi:hypothetical protein